MKKTLIALLASVAPSLATAATLSHEYNITLETRAVDTSPDGNVAFDFETAGIPFAAFDASMGSLDFVRVKVTNEALLRLGAEATVDRANINGSGKVLFRTYVGTTQIHFFADTMEVDCQASLFSSDSCDQYEDDFVSNSWTYSFSASQWDAMNTNNQFAASMQTQAQLLSPLGRVVMDADSYRFSGFGRLPKSKIELTYNYTPNAVAPVPLPASGLILVAGTGGLMLLKRRKSQTKT